MALKYLQIILYLGSDHAVSSFSDVSVSVDVGVGFDVDVGFGVGVVVCVCFCVGFTISPTAVTCWVCFPSNSTCVY